MVFEKKQLALSLPILFVTYCSYGWMLSEHTSERYLWLLAAAAVIPFNWVLTVRLRSIKAALAELLGSDTRAFFTLVGLVFGVVVLVVWIHISAYFLVALSATILARLDLQTAGFTQLQSFATLTSIASLGLGGGLGSEQVLGKYF